MSSKKRTILVAINSAGVGFSIAAIARSQDGPSLIISLLFLALNGFLLYGNLTRK